MIARIINNNWLVDGSLPAFFSALNFLISDLASLTRARISFLERCMNSCVAKEILVVGSVFPGSVASLVLWVIKAADDGSVLPATKNRIKSRDRNRFIVLNFLLKVDKDFIKYLINFCNSKSHSSILMVFKLVPYFNAKLYKDSNVLCGNRLSFIF